MTHYKIRLTQNLQIMATYKCRKCGISKNDTLNSQLNTSITCTVLEDHSDVVFHAWEKTSEEDLVCN
ncbi:hypothetical protein [Gelidibacter japonicus]|uniref:hypothetical protein n=1 Tax=Gelidibacter japonicus TaxID=1962232 RepID=UPI003A8DFB0A